VNPRSSLLRHIRYHFTSGENNHLLSHVVDSAAKWITISSPSQTPLNNVTMKVDLAHIITSSAFCLIVILFRCGYRILSKCQLHTTCHRSWNHDDALMAFATLPLIARAVCTTYVLELRDHDATPSDLVLAAKLLLVSRLGYAML
jgi:hypothetical protein